MATILEVSLYGSMPSLERWSVNPCYILFFDTPLTVPQLQSLGSAVEAVALPTAASNFMSSAVAMTGVRFIQRALTTGNLLSAADVPFNTPKPGGGNASKPFQTSVVLSLRTDDTRPRGKGRLYWPALSAVIDNASLRILNVTALAYLTGLRAYFTALRDAIDNALPGGPGLSNWCVYSRRYNSQAPVTTLMVGDLLDVQRRRRDKAPETYQVLPFV